MTHARFSLLLFICGALCACGGDSGSDEGPSDTVTSDAVESNVDAVEPSDSTFETAPGETREEEPKVGFEILQILSMNEIIVWVSQDLTVEEFEAIELPAGWFKNQPRETDPDGGMFHRSPDAEVDGEFTYEEHYGHEWMHNATVIEANTPLDDDALLRLNRIKKYHTVFFNAGRTLKVLISPKGEKYVRITRDVNRTSEVPTMPDGWVLLDHVTSEKLTIDLPNPTDNIRGDNEDSFQGPVSLTD